MNLMSTARLPDCVRVRPPLYHPDFPYIFFWSQKSGCTTVVKWFFAQLGLLDEALAFSSWVHRYENEVFKAKPGYRQSVHKALTSNDYQAVKVVRDPWRRAPSAFLVLGERGAIGPRPHWVKNHWDKVDAWLTAAGKDPAQGLSFLDHLAMIDAAEREERFTINPHLSQQFVDGETAFLSEVVPIERFQAWTEARQGQPGVKVVDFAAISESRHHHKVDEAVTAALGPTPEATPIVRGAFAQGRFPDGRAFINPRTVEAIKATYAADFQAYGNAYEAPPA
ncbi:MAG: hypothetical protein AAGJ94_17370 [Pseudomonadota bacterium]